MRRSLLIALVLTCGLTRWMAGSDAVTIGASLTPRQPQVTIDGSGRIHLTFGAGNVVYYTCSEDGGATYTEPMQVGRVKFLALGMRRGPRIAVASGVIVVSAIGGEKGGGRDGDLMAWRSEDRGKSWQGPVQVNDVKSSAREGLHGMAAGPTGELFCVWLDLRNKRTQLFGSRSSDGAATWSEDTLIYQSPDGSICECCHPSVLYDRNGTLHFLWRNSLRGNRDMYWMTSPDRGQVFAEAVKLGQGSWPLDACPMDGGAIAIGPKGSVATIWRRDQDVFISSQRPSEHKLGRGLQPWLAANDRDVYSVWLSGRPGDLYFLTANDDRPTKLANRARDPVVAAAPNGPVVVAWETDQDGDSVIKAKTIAAEGR